jgi:hypothetical protein
MVRDEKVDALMGRAKKLGLRVEFDSGLITVVTPPAPGDPERQDAIIAELWKYRSDVRRLVEGRASAARASELLGQRIWSEYGEGVLASASGDGALVIDVAREGFRNSQTLTANAESLLVIVVERADGAASPRNEEAKPAQPRRKIFGFLQHGSREE